MGGDQPSSPAGPSGSNSRNTYDQFEEEAPMLPRVPVGARRLSGTRRVPVGPAGNGVGLALWSAITLPVRLVMSILSGTWYFLSESCMRTSTCRVCGMVRGTDDTSIDFHAIVILEVHASFPPPTYFSTNTPSSKRSNDDLTLVRQGFRTLYRMFSD